MGAVWLKLEAYTQNRRHWNYVRRQMFVLDTYADQHDRRASFVANR